VWLDWDRKKYEYLAQVRWDKLGPLTLAVQTRDQKELALLRADPATGKTMPLVVEKDDAWLNLRPDVPRWLPGERGFLWISEAGGRPRVELRKPDGKHERDLFAADIGPEALVSVNTEAGDMIVSASNDPTQAQLYHARLDSTDVKPRPFT